MLQNKTVDARGYSCPEPLLLTKKALEEEVFPLVVMVNSQGAKENILRYAHKNTMKTAVEETENHITITINQEE